MNPKLRKEMDDLEGKDPKGMDPEVERFFRELRLDLKNLGQPFTLERLKVLFNFTIAGAILFIALTIKGKTSVPTALEQSGTQGPLEVVIVDPPRFNLELDEVDVNIKDGPRNGLAIRSDLGGIDVKLNQIGLVRIQDETIRPLPSRY